MEHPWTSRVWKLPIIAFLLGSGTVFLIELDQCAWVKRPGVYADRSRAIARGVDLVEFRERLVKLPWRRAQARRRTQ